MSIRDALLEALRALRTHWLRSALTMLSLVLGVSAVVLLFACGQGVKNSVDARIEPVVNNITIVSQAEAVPNGPPARTLTDFDAAALRRAPDIATLAPAVTSSGQGATTQGSTTGARTLIENNTTRFLTGDITGTTDNWARANSRDFTAGSFFDAAQNSSAARVVVLGPYCRTHPLRSRPRCGVKPDSPDQPCAFPGHRCDAELRPATGQHRGHAADHRPPLCLRVRHGQHQ